MAVNIRRAVPMRPIAGPDDENRALELFSFALYDDHDAFVELIPNEVTPKPVAIAIDGSAAELDIYRCDLADWTTDTIPLRRIVVMEKIDET